MTSLDRRQLLVEEEAVNNLPKTASLEIEAVAIQRRGRNDRLGRRSLWRAENGLGQLAEDPMDGSAAARARPAAVPKGSVTYTQTYISTIRDERQRAPRTAIGPFRPPTTTRTRDRRPARS